MGFTYGVDAHVDCSSEGRAGEAFPWPKLAALDLLPHDRIDCVELAHR
jgi:hypothetical protein